MEPAARQLFSLTTSDRQRLVLGVMLIPLAASCVLATGFCLARAAQAQGQDNARSGEVRVVVTERDRRVEGMEIVCEEDAVRPGDAGERLDSPPQHALCAALPHSQSGLGSPGNFLESKQLTPPDPVAEPGNPRGPPSGGYMG
ncbi:MAG: hypothetical protein JJU11_02210 [Candidatus Sumerlaeia bacterium]|nr:hypothetical protein [Candidatus Sumerlaeia bacterium]